MQLDVIFPHALWLLLLLPLLWAITLAAPSRLPRWRAWTSLLLRSLAVAGLVLGLAGAQLVRPVGALTTVFLIDGSDSVALSQRARAEAFVQQALDRLPTDDQAAIVVFGERALVERTPSPERTLGQLTVTPGGAATNIEDAVQLGLALLPNEGRQRLVLLSDGGENSGDARAAARLAAARGVPIDVVSLSGLADGPDAQVAGVELPASAREGQRLRMQISLESATATRGRLTVAGPDGRLLTDEAVDLPAGSRQLELLLPAAAPGFNRYVVRLEAPGDVRSQNNAAEAFSLVSGPPHVLLVEGQPDDAASLAQALQATANQVSTIRPEQLPGGLAELSSYDAVVLVNVPRRAVPERTISALATYVYELGRSLMMVGGPQSFGAGGWRDTPVEQALPVTMDIPSHLRRPPISIVVLIDTSGSMSAKEGDQTKLQLAATGAQRIASLMRDEDELTVIPFDSEPGAIVGPLPGSQREAAIDALSTIEPGGGGINIRDGLTAAARAIRASSLPIRHIITLTDGSDTVQQDGALDIVRELHAEAVTLTSVAIGNGDHVPFIEQMAERGGGRTFLTEQASEIPTILADETQVLLRPYLIEQDFRPVQQAIHPILRDIRETPLLHGYVATGPRATAQTLLASPDGDPVLAVWQYGLGRSLAWTSDLGGRWGSDWLGWQQFPQFSTQLVAWLLPPRDSQALAVQTSTQGDQLVLSVQAQDARGGPQTGLTVSGRLLGSTGDGLDIGFHEVGPGQYRASVGGAPPGAYLLQLVARDAQGQPAGSVVAGAVMPRSTEYRSRGANPALLEALTRSTGGLLDPTPAEVFRASSAGHGAVSEIGQALLWMALLLLPFDIALRRLLIGPRGLLQRRTASDQPPPAQRHTTASPPAPAQPRWGRNRAARSNNELEQLRAAQELARKRARGEE